MGMRLKPVEEQVVALMGASSGIGRESALRFARRGAKVVVSARGEEGLDSLVEEIRQEGGQATAVVADTSEFEQVKAGGGRAAGVGGRADGRRLWSPTPRSSSRSRRWPTARWRSTGGSTPGCTWPGWGSSPPS